MALGLVLQVVTEDLLLPAPVAVGLLSPWIDLIHSGQSQKSLDLTLDPTLSMEHFLQPVAQAYAGSHSPALPSISPLFALSPPLSSSSSSSLPQPASFHFPPPPPPQVQETFFKVTVSDSSPINFKRKKGIAVDLQISQGLWHVYEWYPHLPEASMSLHHISSYLNSAECLSLHPCMPVGDI